MLKRLLPAMLLFVVVGNTPLFAQASGEMMLVNAIEGHAVEVKDKKVFEEEFIRLAETLPDRANVTDIGGSPHAYYCSGFVQDLYRKNGIWLPAVSVAHQAKFGEKLNRLTDVEPGDLVFFSAKSSARVPAHVAVAVGYGRLLHASGAEQRVSVVALTPELKQNFMFARRLITSV